MLTLAQLQASLNGTVAVDFSVAAEGRYGFIARSVCRFGYRRLKRAEKAVVLRFLERVHYQIVLPIVSSCDPTETLLCLKTLRNRGS
jgi:hypothetical protein